MLLLIDQQISKAIVKMMIKIEAATNQSERDSDTIMLASQQNNPSTHLSQQDDTLPLNSRQNILKAIHECVVGSTIRHVLKFPPDTLIQYLSEYPFYRGADTLYYLLLKKIGSDAHYAPNGKHLVLIHPELLGVYVLAEQNLKALSNREASSFNGLPDETIYPLIRANIDRTITCDRYQLRHSIIVGEAPLHRALEIPSIALNIPIYQQMFDPAVLTANLSTILIENDCWEPFKSLHLSLFNLLLLRMGYTKGVYPNLWNLILQDYYEKQLLRLNIHDHLSSLATRQIVTLNNLFPGIVKLPKIDTIGVRLWFAPRSVRAYLLGFDVSDGIPSDEIISEKLQRLQEIGIEKYANEVTGICVNDDNILTGKIGIMTYPDLAGKRLLNTKDLVGSSLDIYYPQDLYSIITEEGVAIITRKDIESFLTYRHVISIEEFTSILIPENISYLTESPSETVIKDIFYRYICDIPIRCGVPVRNKLVETMSWDTLNY